MDDYFAAIELQRGFIARSDVLLIGLDDRFIRHQIYHRAWTRIRQGAYISTTTWARLDAFERHRRLARAVMHRHGDAVALSNVSGLVMRPGYGIWGVDLSKVHVIRRDGRSGSSERDVIHHEGPVRDEDCELVDGLLVVKEARCLVETVLRNHLEAGVVVLDSGLHIGRVQRPELEELSAAMHRVGGHRTLDVALRLADSRAESPGESRSRYLYWSQGLPQPEVQFEVLDRDGILIGWTDLAWPDLGLLFEFDGRVKYGRLLKPGQDPGDVVFEEKKREDALRRATGFAVERMTWADLSRPVEMARRARQRMTVRANAALP